MCGIAGIFNMEREESPTLDEVRSMVATMRHRGPDAAGAAVLDPRTAFGHARLSILDLRPEANQPFRIRNGELSVTYNGEIFNFVELREELEGKGHRFETTCDTEVLLRAYDEWGPDCVGRFNGMWAFAIYDRRSDLLFCSRDRFGIKPFVYARNGGRFLFASEVKALLAVERNLAQPNWSALSMLLRSHEGYQITETCFENVLRLPPAHNMTVTRADVRLWRYWDYPCDADQSMGVEEAAEGLRELLVDAVRLRMRSDVPVGSTLSGGVDSSTIVSLLRTFYDGPHHTFSAAYEGEEWSEAERAEQLSRDLGMTPNAVPASSGDFLPTLQKCIRHVEGPHRSSAILPLWNIMEVARTQVTCVLEGQGADELLAGYPREVFPAAIADHIRRGRLARAARELRWQVATLGIKDVALWSARTAFPWLQHPFTALRGDRWVYAGPLRNAAKGKTGRADTLPPIDDGLNSELRFEHEGSLVSLLHYGDAISMAHSIESRLPFMDYRLVEHCFRIPGHLKLMDGRGKAVLRHAVRNDVPREILAPRVKYGFPTSASRWMREDAEKTVYPVLFTDRCRQRGIFDPKALETAVERHRAGKVDISHHIFRWMGTELWFQEFIDGP